MCLIRCIDVLNDLTPLDQFCYVMRFDKESDTSIRANLCARGSGIMMKQGSTCKDDWVYSCVLDGDLGVCWEKAGSVPAELVLEARKRHPDRLA